MDWHRPEVRRWLAVRPVRYQLNLQALPAHGAQTLLHVDRAAFLTENRHTGICTDISHSHQWASAARASEAAPSPNEARRNRARRLAAFRRASNSSSISR